MGFKLKIFGLGLLAITSMAAFAVVNAGADTGGHFTWEAPHTKVSITGTETPTHKKELTVPGLTGIACDSALYEGTAESANQTVTQLTLTTKTSGCKTTGGTAGETVVDMNGCHYLFTIGDDPTKTHTVHIVCPGAKKYTAITHQGCEIRVPAQTIGGTATSGVQYTTIIANEKHAITLDINWIGFTTHFEAGFCVLLGTTKSSNITGSATLEGFGDAGNSFSFPHGEENGAIGFTATTSAQ